MAKLLAERINNNKNNNKNKEISRSGLLLPVEYLRNGKRYSSSVSHFWLSARVTLPNGTNVVAVFVIVSVIL